MQKLKSTYIYTVYIYKGRPLYLGRISANDAKTV